MLTLLQIFIRDCKAPAGLNVTIHWDQQYQRNIYQTDKNGHVFIPSEHLPSESVIPKKIVVNLPNGQTHTFTGITLDKGHNHLLFLEQSKSR